MQRPPLYFSCFQYFFPRSRHREWKQRRGKRRLRKKKITRSQQHHQWQPKRRKQKSFPLPFPPARNPFIIGVTTRVDPMKSATPCSDTTSQKKNNNKCRGNNLVVRNITPRSLSSSVFSPPNQVTHSGYAELLKTKKKDSESFFFPSVGLCDIYTYGEIKTFHSRSWCSKKPQSLSLSFFFLFVIFKLVAMFSPTFSLSHQLPSLKRLGQLSTHESFFGGEREWKQLDKFTLVLHKERKRYDLAHIGLGRVARVF